MPQPPDDSTRIPTGDPGDEFGTSQLHRAAQQFEDPKEIGPYRILGKIGEGGMGIVYRAQRTTPFRQEVAVKVIKVGMDTREVVSRFQAERQMLATLDHPNIAKVLDGGATPDGRPYFVMEYVAGEKITGFCDRHRLTTRERLELFAQVCDAIHHAHMKGIIHRDIKPSNVLVALRDNVRTPVVIDFGVARATNRSMTERTFFTERGELIGTPEYMSPEQAESNELEIDTRSDVYSLGVVLYELLAGALPFDPQTLRSAGWREMQRIIREAPQPRPSTKLSSLANAREVAQRRQVELENLAAELRGELEWIPLKAMRQDRTQRYRAAIELADDVRNYLAAKPLIAGPESLRYKLRKFVRRNRLKVITYSTAAGIVLLVAGVSGAMILRADARRRTAESERAAEQARSDAMLERYGVTILNVAAANAATSAAQTDRATLALLDTAIVATRNFLEIRPNDFRLRTKLGDYLNTVGGIKAQMSDPIAAVSLEEALRIRTALLSERPDAATGLAVACTQANLGLVAAGSNDPAKARSAYTQAIAQIESLLAGGRSAEAVSALAQIHHNLGVLLDSQHDRAGAERQFARAIELRSELFAANLASERFRLEHSASLNALAKLIADDRPADAIPLFRQACELREVIIARQGSTENLRDLAESLAWLSQLMAHNGDAADAEGARQRAIRHYQQLLNDEQHYGPKRAAMEVYQPLVFLRLLAGEFSAAEATARQALAIDPNHAVLRVQLATAMLMLGRLPEARQEFAALKGTKIDGDSAADYVQRDFDDLRKAGRDSPHFGEIVELLRQ